MKRFSFILIMIILLFMLPTYADDFTLIDQLPIDPEDDLPEFMIIEELRIPIGAIAIGPGYIKGYPDNTFRPDQNISQVEFSALIARAIGISGQASNSQVDLPYEHWGYDAYASMKAYGLTCDEYATSSYMTKKMARDCLRSTSDFMGTTVDFDPLLKDMNDLLTRAESVKLINVLMGIHDEYFKLIPFSDVDYSHPYASAIAGGL